MLKVDDKIQIISLYKNGIGKREIAVKLGISKNTVKKHIKNFEVHGEQSVFQNKYDKLSQCENYKEFILNYLNDFPKISALRVFEKLKDEHEYTHGYDSVRRYLRTIKRSEKVVAHYNDAIAGDEAQVDFGYVGLLYDPIQKKKRKANVFCMRLIYSRYDYYEIVFDQKVSTFLQCHLNAFKYFNGVPKNVKIDNLKAAILETTLYSREYQKDYLEFSTHYGFCIYPSRVYKPRDKAYVENGIKYVKHNFFSGRKFNDVDECRELLLTWMKDKAKRTHGTTRLVPENVFFNEEQKLLTKLPERHYELSEWVTQYIVVLARQFLAKSANSFGVYGFCP